MHYEVFTRKSARIANPAVTINPVGRIYLNQEAANYFAANRVKSVLLLWDGQNLRAGIMPAKGRNRNAYRIAYSHKGSGASLTAKSFLNWISYDADELITVDAVWNDEEDMLEFEIPDENLLND